MIFNVHPRSNSILNFGKVILKGYVRTLSASGCRRAKCSKSFTPEALPLQCPGRTLVFQVNKQQFLRASWSWFSSSACHLHGNVLQESNSANENVSIKKSLPQRFVEACPPKWQPYLRLSRVHQPIGTWLLFWPCTWGLGLATGGLPDLTLLALFGTGAFIMRGAGCTINDMWDRHIDRKVRRTIDRPLASGELRMRHAAAWLIFQLSLAFSILLQLNYPCFIIGVSSLGLVTMYPLAKRVTHWPQAVLGTAFNIGVLMGFTAVAKYSHLGYLTYPWLDPSCLSLYIAGISWTLIYDTIYAHQDRDDDAVLGLGSTARRFGENTKTWLTGFSSLTTGSLITSGIVGNLGWPYFAAVTGVTAHLAWQIGTLDINNHQNCSERFRTNRHIGWLVFLGIIGSGFLSQSNKDSSSDPNSTAISNFTDKNFLKSSHRSTTTVTPLTSQLELKAAAVTP